MKARSSRFKSTCLAAICLFNTLHATCQNSVWGGVNSAKQSEASNVAKAKKTAGDYKKRLMQWGLDSNYNHGVLLGGRANTNGWSGNVFIEKRHSYKVTSFWLVNFSEVKHDKQVKVQSGSNSFPQLGAATPFVYGKVNNLYTLNVGYGRDVLLLPSLVEGNIAVSFRYDGGVSLAMLKPYYLKLIYTDAVNDIPYLETQKYSSSNEDKFLNSGAILGAAGWSKGLGDMQYIPGLYGEASIAITPSKAKALIEMVTLGIHGAYYAKSLPIMADQKALPYNVCLFAGLDVGKRWR